MNQAMLFEEQVNNTTFERTNSHFEHPKRSLGPIHSHKFALTCQTLEDSFSYVDGIWFQGNSVLGFEEHNIVWLQMLRCQAAKRQLGLYPYSTRWGIDFLQDGGWTTNESSKTFTFLSEEVNRLPRGRKNSMKKQHSIVYILWSYVVIELQ